MTDEITAGSGNIYADLGFENADEMFLKAQLAASIKGILDGKGLTQVKAAEMLGLPQPKLSRLLNGHFDNISEAKMLDCIARLGRDIHITIGPESSMPCGRIEVLHAI
ncbi:MAG: helix-turn-helix domain-containing protein [Desulfovibrio sp.]|jgi:predicted XRE-type DNA-binding protein|nr:helix-turn-helix domain-containing protein [Desulfovibrio sp.]